MNAILLELLEKAPQAIRVIPVIYEKRSVNMREFLFYGKMSEKKGREVRDMLRSEWGLLIVVEEPTERTTNDKELHLTKEGEEVARILMTLEPVLETGKKKARAAERS